MDKAAAVCLVLLAGCGKSTLATDAGGRGGCDYGGKRYATGDSFKSTDGCNECSCTASGQVACTERACIDAAPGDLSWYRTCGAPVCGPSSSGPTGQSPCTTEKVGEVCTKSGVLCDPGLGCGVNLICASSDPTKGTGGCPISRARYKKDIQYLSEPELSEVADQVLRMPLARFRYRDASSREQIGFIIEDVEPSPSVEGDHVDLYGYTSMTVAAVQVQSEQLRALEREVLMMRAHLLELEQRCGK